MIILAFIVLIIKLPFILLKFLFANKRLAVILAVALVVFLGIRTLNRPSQTTAVELPQYQKEAPALSKAPFCIPPFAQSGRLYYVADFTVNTPGGQLRNAVPLPEDYLSVTLNKFYYFDREEWEIGKLPLPMDRKNLPDLVIYQR